MNQSQAKGLLRLVSGGSTSPRCPRCSARSWRRPPSCAPTAGWGGRAPPWTTSRSPPAASAAAPGPLSRCGILQTPSSSAVALLQHWNNSNIGSRQLLVRCENLQPSVLVNPDSCIFNKSNSELRLCRNARALALMWDPGTLKHVHHSQILTLLSAIMTLLEY